jgi:glyoxylase-like metal-dependent hydrolase (beta-lactamase superfamily II)
MTGPELTREGERYASRARDLDYLPEDPPEPGEAHRGARVVTADAAADGAQSHQSLAPRGRRALHDRRTGLAAEACRAAWESLERTALAGRRLARVFVTHDHPDHMGLARWLAERHGDSRSTVASRAAHTTPSR